MVANGTKDELPDVDYVIQSYDTAFLKKRNCRLFCNYYLGCIFYPNEDSKPNLILMDTVKDRFEFPELRRVALDQYNIGTGYGYR